MSLPEDGTIYVYGIPAVGATTNSRVSSRENQLDIPDNDPFNRWHLTGKKFYYTTERSLRGTSQQISVEDAI